MNSVDINTMINRHKIFLLFLLIFLLMVTGYYISYDYRAFPDGIAHLGYIYNVIEYGFPDYKTGQIFESYKYNYLNHPPLYYLLAGLIAKVLNGWVDPVTVARFLNIIVSIGILTVVYKILMYLRVSALAVFTGLSIFLLTPMYLELSVAVNNDLLSVLGSTLALWALVLFGESIENNKRTILILFIGGAIAALTKATATLAIVTFVFFHFIFHWRLWLKTIRSMSYINWAIPVLVSVLVGGYYIFVLIYYGKLFPAPQGNPADYYLVMYPDAPRWGVIENLTRFFEGNLFSFSRPYGHQVFEDIDIRYQVLCYSMVLLAVLIFIGVVMNGENKRLSYWIWSGFLIFVTLYFYTLRRMHINTGYQGAFQARYFYSYLPVFSIGLVLAIDCVNSRLLRFFYVLVVVVNTVLGVYPAYGKLIVNHFYGKVSAQGNATGTFGELISGRSFEQTFIVEGENLEEINILLATFARLNDNTLNIKIITSTGKCLFDTSLKTKSLHDNSWVTLKTNLKNLTMGEMYTLQLTSPDAYAGNAITWWAWVEQSENPHFANTKFGPTISQGYADGEAIVDGVPKPDSDFAFRLYFK